MNSTTVEAKSMTKVVASVEEKPSELVINTNLKGRAEAFRMLALADTLRLPLLLKGVPGVGKTNCVMDYANTRQAGGASVFKLELDEYTHPAEVKGRPNLKKLAEDNLYEVISPIKDSDVIIVNEIDKASGGMRNAFMSIMNEKKLFNGVEEIDLKYSLFVGTCNAIPRDEVKSPFWDRFVLQYDVNRMTQEQLMDYFKSGTKQYVDTIRLKLPTRSEIADLKTITENKMKRMTAACYDHCSDRTLTHLPSMIKAISMIWSCNIDAAFIRAAEILAGPSVAKMVADQITTREMKAIFDKIDMIHGISTMDALKRAVHEINVLVTNYAKDKKITNAQLAEVEEVLTATITDKGVDITDLRKSMGK